MKVAPEGKGFSTNFTPGIDCVLYDSMRVASTVNTTSRPCLPQAVVDVVSELMVVHELVVEQPLLLSTLQGSSSLDV